MIPCISLVRLIIFWTGITHSDSSFSSRPPILHDQRFGELLWGDDLNTSKNHKEVLLSDPDLNLSFLFSTKETTPPGPRCTPAPPGSRRPAHCRRHCRCRRSRSATSAPSQSSSRRQTSWRTWGWGSSWSSPSGQSDRYKRYSQDLVFFHDYSVNLSSTLNKF